VLFELCRSHFPSLCPWSFSLFQPVQSISRRSCPCLSRFLLFLSLSLLYFLLLSLLLCFYLYLYFLFIFLCVFSINKYYLVILLCSVQVLCRYLYFSSLSESFLGCLHVVLILFLNSHPSIMFYVSLSFSIYVFISSVFFFGIFYSCLSIEMFVSIDWVWLIYVCFHSFIIMYLYV